MDLISVTMVRIYTLEHSDVLKPVLQYLNNEAKVSGVTVFRAIEGFGTTGEHSNSLLDMRSTLPIVIEFFEHADLIQPIITKLSTMVKAEHIVFFDAKTYAQKQ